MSFEPSIKGAESSPIACYDTGSELTIRLAPSRIPLMVLPLLRSFIEKGGSENLERNRTE